MSDIVERCPHEYHEREASVYAEGLCPLCLLAEIARLRAAIKSVSSKECPCTTCQILWRALGAKSVRNDGEGEYVKLKIDDA
jgi:hypothetical protein